MQLEIIGCAGAWPTPQARAGSGYLLTWDKTRLLIDCGHGVMGEFMGAVKQKAPPTDIYITHGHADHTADLVSLAYCLKFGPWKGTGDIRLHCRKDVYDQLNAVVAAHGGPDALSSLEYVEVAESFEIAGKTFTTHLVPHLIPTYAIRTEGFAFSADTGVEDDPEWARGAECILSEAALPPGWEGGEGFHLTPEQAAKLAHTAGAQRLLLTHLPWADSEWEANYMQAASKEFAGEIIIVKPGLVVSI